MKPSPEAVAAINKAVATIGGQKAAAELLGVSQQAVSRWLTGIDWTPVRRARQLEAQTGVPAASMVNPDKVL